MGRVLGQVTLLGQSPDYLSIKDNESEMSLLADQEQGILYASTLYESTVYCNILNNLNPLS